VIINLAGCNIDTDVLHQLLADGNPSVPRVCHALTPEVLSAAYARISRAPDSVDELRRKAAEDVAAARALAEKIVFGYGHASVAEHAVFNFDIIDVSRLAIEAVEHARLCSYTEKSQRYVTFDPDKVEFWMPAEIVESGFANLFTDYVKETHAQYHNILARIEGQERPQGGSPQEDARYVTTLAVTGQLGMTANARNLECMVRRLAAHPLSEVRTIGEHLFKKAKELAPSLFKYEEPEPFRTALPRMLEQTLRLRSQSGFAPSIVELLAGPAALESGESSGDLLILAALVHQVSQAPFEACHHALGRLTPADRQQFMKQVLAQMDVYSAAPRCFELCDCTFELVVSASCFAQLKRHRMMTLLPQGYDPTLGCTIPPSVSQDEGASERFKAIMRAAEALHRKLARQINPAVAEYALTQAHRRRVVVKMNARELYAFSRLREDGHAQWEIREIAHTLIGLARRTMPLTLALACGKDQFEEWRKQMLGG
jgi:flavin-dependent thymidylate synthase